MDDLITVLLAWGDCPGGCASIGVAAGANPESYEDCEEMCESLLSDSEAWTSCMQGCFQSLCNRGYTEFCDD